MLEIDSVSLNFGDKKVLSGCYLSCRKGEIVGLLGRNGSGKSTLLKIIFGTQKADFMHLRIGGEIITKGYRSGIAYLPQENFIPPFITVNELLAEVEGAGLLNAELSQTFQELRNTRLSALSGGELKLIECLWTLARPVDFILLDEPFSGISPLHIGIMQELFQRVAQTKGLILTDHLYRPLLEISTRVVLLHNRAIYNIKDDSELIRYNYIPEHL